MNAIIVADTVWSLISSSFHIFSRYEVVYETGNVTTLQLSNVFEGIVPAFDYRKPEISLPYFYLALEICRSLRILVLYSETWNFSAKRKQ